jgi:translation initiation factor 1
MARDNDPLLYSTDGSHLRPRPAPAGLVPTATRLRLRLDTKGRRGKAVTVVEGLPELAEAAAGLLRQLKTHCGTGGTLKDGALELQGDQRDKAQERLGYPVRRAGS